MCGLNSILNIIYTRRYTRYYLQGDDARISIGRAIVAKAVFAVSSRHYTCIRVFFVEIRNNIVWSFGRKGGKIRNVKSNPIGWSSVTLTRLHGEQWHWRFLLLFRLVRFEVSSGHVNQLEREARRRSTKSGTRHACLRVSIIKHNASGGIFFGPTPRRSAIQGFSGYVRAIVKQRPSRRKRACLLKCLYREFFSTSSATKSCGAITAQGRGFDVAIVKRTRHVGW